MKFKTAHVNGLRSGGTTLMESPDGCTVVTTAGCFRVDAGGQLVASQPTERESEALAFADRMANPTAAA